MATKYEIVKGAGKTMWLIEAAADLYADDVPF